MQKAHSCSGDQCFLRKEGSLHLFLGPNTELNQSFRDSNFLTSIKKHRLLDYSHHPFDIVSSRDTTLLRKVHNHNGDDHKKRHIQYLLVVYHNARLPHKPLHRKPKSHAPPHRRRSQKHKPQPRHNPQDRRGSMGSGMDHVWHHKRC